MKSDDSLSIMLVSPTDAKALSQLAKQCYLDHFSYLWEDSGRGYAEATFAEKVLQLELADPESRTYWAQYQQQPVGYMKINLNVSLGKFPDALELQRIYLLTDAIGKGVGQALMKKCFETAHQENKELVWLNVMASSQESINFYQKFGFIEHAKTLLTYPNLKPEYQNMLVMKKVINNPNRRESDSKFQ